MFLFEVQTGVPGEGGPLNEVLNVKRYLPGGKEGKHVHMYGSTGAMMVYLESVQYYWMEDQEGPLQCILPI